MGNWEAIFVEPAKTILYKIGEFVGNFFLVIIILIVGWIVARALKTLITNLLKAVKLDRLSEKITLNALLARGGIKYTLSELIGILFYWIALLVTFVIAINAINLTIAAELLNRIILYIPNVIAAIFIMVLGMFFATILKNTVNTAASNAGLSQSKFLAKLVEIVVIVFTLMVALEQLNIGARIIELLISVTLASLGLGMALAFGLGCRDIAGKFTAELIEKMKTKK